MWIDNLIVCLKALEVGQEEHSVETKNHQNGLSVKIIDTLKSAIQVRSWDLFAKNKKIYESLISKLNCLFYQDLKIGQKEQSDVILKQQREVFESLKTEIQVRLSLLHT